MKDKEIILLPINTIDTHWLLLVVIPFFNDNKKGKLILLDSHPTKCIINYKETVQVVILWFNRLYCTNFFKKTKDTVLTPVVPYQKDSKSCGVYVCKFIEILYKAKDINDTIRNENNGDISSIFQEALKLENEQEAIKELIDDMIHQFDQLKVEFLKD